MKQKEDFIWLILGKSRRGKTTRALELLKPPRAICYTSRLTNEKMVERYRGRMIPDTPEYMDKLETFLTKYKDILIFRKSENNDHVFKRLSNVKNCEILIDDVTLVIEKDWPFLQFLASVGMNFNRVFLTTHCPRGDMPKKGVTLAVRVEIVGGWASSDDILWFSKNLSNQMIEFEELENRLKQAKWGEVTILTA